MVSILQLLATKEGSNDVILRVLQDAAASVTERHPRTQEGPFHVLFRRCVYPLEICSNVKVLLSHGADVNLLDHHGVSPLSLLILHINHGLRYHCHPLPEIQRLEDLGAPKSQIQEKMAEIDAKYQAQVYESLEMLLMAGADVNAVPDVVPAIPSYSHWVEAYEHKLMQQSGRWNLLGYDTSMEYSTYNIFNPVSSHRCMNEQKLTPLHLAAWRGDARCLQLLLKYGADPTVLTADTDNTKNTIVKGGPKWTNLSSQKKENTKVKQGRSVLHFLYMYCNKPMDLVQCTKVLLSAGTDATVCHQGDYAVHLLIPHVLVKRSYHQYLSNTYHLRELRCEPAFNNYLPELRACFEMLAQAQSGHTEQVWHGLLLKLFKQFRHVLSDTDKSFQIQSHYLVPYTFQLTPLTEFTRFLIATGSKVNMSDAEGQTPLHHLVAILHDISTEPILNSSAATCELLTVLLTGGADSNKKDIYLKTPLFAMVLLCLESVSSDTEDTSIFYTLLDLISMHGGDLNVRDCLSATPLSRVVASFHDTARCAKIIRLTQFLEILLINGADPDMPCAASDHSLHNDANSPVYALGMILRLHLESHIRITMEDGAASSDVSCPGGLADVIVMLMVCMSQRAIARVIKELFDKNSFRYDVEYGSFKDELAAQCEACACVVQYSENVFPLKAICRQVLRTALRGRYKHCIPYLPLPAEIKCYLLDLTLC